MFHVDDRDIAHFVSVGYSAKSSDEVGEESYALMLSADDVRGLVGISLAEEIEVCAIFPPAVVTDEAFCCWDEVEFIYSLQESL